MVQSWKCPQPNGRCFRFRGKNESQAKQERIDWSVIRKVALGSVALLFTWQIYYFNMILHRLYPILCEVFVCGNYHVGLHPKTRCSIPKWEGWDGRRQVSQIFLIIFDATIAPVMFSLLAKAVIFLQPSVALPFCSIWSVVEPIKLMYGGIYVYV